MDVLAILQARCNSSRLPNKVLKPILGKPMIQWQIERLQNSKNIDELLVATSTELSDEPLIELCNSIGVNTFRGNLDNVLERFYKATQMYEPKPKFIVRLTGDCPLIDWTIVDDVISHIKANGFDYVSNSLEPTFPDGLDVEVMSIETLESIYSNAKLQSEKEHVTLHVVNNLEKYNVGLFKNSSDLSHYRWTVDESVDFEFVTEIFESLVEQKERFLMGDILELLQKRPLLSIKNSKIQRNEGLMKSLENDK